MSNPSAVDLRHQDLTDQDLSGKSEILLGYADFDTATLWPANLPGDFRPDEILQLGMDPGLSIRELHKQGITGKGVRVAFLDQTLLVEHLEYADRVTYREIGPVPDEAQMHGPAVLSLLAGARTGVAPEVSVLYYAPHMVEGDRPTWANHARAIHEILDANATLPPNERIRVIGVSWGYDPGVGGYGAIKEAITRAKAEDVFVLTTTVESDYNFRFHGLDRDPRSDPNDPNSYRPGGWWQREFYANPDFFRNRILVPMDSRTTASPTGSSDYVFYRQAAGAGWCPTWLGSMRWDFRSTRT